MSNNDHNNKQAKASDWLNSLSQRDKRSLVFHLLYAAEGCDYQASLESLVDNLNKGFDLDIPFNSPMLRSVQEIIDHREALDQVYRPYLSNWRIERIGVCTKLILRYAIWELLNTKTTPTIIINEAIELAKCFAEKDAYKFVNGILDEIAKTLPTLKKTM
jgi:transcription antitermination protein NusB